MIYLLLTVVQSTLIFVAFRLFKNFRIDTLQAIATNYIVATVFGFLINDQPATVSDISNSLWFPYAIALGFLFIGTFYVFGLSSQKVGVALTSVASKMSVVIPVIFGVILYSDRMSVIKVLGILAALVAFYLTFKKKGAIQLRTANLLYPVLMFIGNGSVDTVMKYTEHHHIESDLVLFLSIIFLTSFIIGIAIISIRIGYHISKFKVRNILGGVILGLLNFGSTFYILKAMGVYESSVVFPIANSAIVMLSALIGFIAFREKLSLINWIGILISIMAILIIANA
jgi:drug/metabolite transporter (DMT)-like permease